MPLQQTNNSNSNNYSNSNSNSNSTSTASKLTSFFGMSSSSSGTTASTSSSTAPLGGGGGGGLGILGGLSSASHALGKIIYNYRLDEKSKNRLFINSLPSFLLPLCSPLFFFLSTPLFSSSSLLPSFLLPLYSPLFFFLSTPLYPSPSLLSSSHLISITSFSIYPRSPHLISSSINSFRFVWQQCS